LSLIPLIPHLEVRYANSRHTEEFPRISATIGDGQTSYNYGNDGFEQALAGCSVRSPLFVVSFARPRRLYQLELRQRSVPTKMKVTYLAKEWLEVRLRLKVLSPCLTSFARSSSNTKPVGFPCSPNQLCDLSDRSPSTYPPQSGRMDRLYIAS
jgi:hypothetical protein